MDWSLQIDYFERAKRLEEIPLIKKAYEEQRVKDMELWELQEEERVRRYIYLASMPFVLNIHKAIVEGRHELNALAMENCQADWSLFFVITFFYIFIVVTQWSMIMVHLFCVVDQQHEGGT